MTAERAIKVLAVEDSENDVALAIRVLRKSGFAAHCTRVQDLAALQQALSEGSWDAVISDFSMPGFSGLDALHEFRKTGLDIPFIFVSGTIGEEMAVSAMKAGANDYVMKDNMSRLGPALERELAQAARRAAHRESETELSRFELQLHQAQKMESLGTLAGGIAHDFNNILGAILGNAELARADLAADHPVQDTLGQIQKAGLRARDLVRQILTFSRRQPQQLQDIVLGAVIEETHHLLRATLPAGVELVLQLSEEPVLVSADATQLQQVLLNLCTNAWHALRGESGRIVIGLEAMHLDAAAARQRNGLVAGVHAHLWVNDTGVGMDAATVNRIFEPFFTTKPVGQGTGLGLSVVHGIVVAHQGSISVESEPGQGTSFHILLPAISAAVPVPAVALPSARRAGRGERIVYLDDDETVMLVIVRILERAGFRCNGFCDIGEALALIRESGDEIDIFVTDYNMPERSGLEVAREVIASRPGLPVVISSGLISDELREQAMLAGVRALVEKEVAFQELAAVIAGLLPAQG